MVALRDLRSKERSSPIVALVNVCLLYGVAAAVLLGPTAYEWRPPLCGLGGCSDAQAFVQAFVCRLMSQKGAKQKLTSDTVIKHVQACSRNLAEELHGTEFGQLAM